MSCLLPSFGTGNEGISGKLMEIAQNQGQGMSGFLTNVGRTSPPVGSEMAEDTRCMCQGPPRQMTFTGQEYRA